MATGNYTTKPMMLSLYPLHIHILPCIHSFNPPPHTPMLCTLRDAAGAGTVYSFGRVAARIDTDRYELAFRGHSIVVATERHIDLHSWIRVYGTVRAGILRPVFVDRLSGMDINLLEKAIGHIREQL